MKLKSLAVVCLFFVGQTTYAYQNHYGEVRGPGSINNSYKNHDPFISQNHRQSYEDALINEAFSYYDQLNNQNKPLLSSKNYESIDDCNVVILNGTSIHDFTSLTVMSKTEYEAKLKREQQERLEAEKKAQEEAKRKQEQERIEAERKAAQLKALNNYKASITKAMQDDVELAAYSKAYQELDEPTLNTAHERYKAILQNRKDALTSYNHNCDTWKKKTYQFLDKAQKLLNEQSMKLAEYATFYGNKIQRVIHKEFVMIIHDTADMRYVEDDFNRDRESIATTIMRFVQTGELYNKNGKLGKAFSTADFCLGLLDCYGYILKETMVNPTITISQCGFAATKGAVKGCVNFGFKVIQPERTIIELSDSLGYLADATWEYLKFAYEENKKDFPRLHAQLQQDAFDLSTGKVTRWDLLQRNLGNVKHNIGHNIERVNAILVHTCRKLDKETVLDGIEMTAEMATEMLLTNQTASALGTLIGNGSSALSDIIKAGDGARKFNDLPLNGQTLQALISYEAVMADVQAATGQGIKVVGVAVEEIVDGTSIIFPPFMLMAKSGPGGSRPNNPTGGPGNIPNPPMDIIQAMQPLSAEERAVLAKYNGLVTHNGHPVILPFEHTWVAKISTNGEINGFHQDRMRFYEQLGLLKDIDPLAEDFYRAKVYFHGKWIERSFFPAKWTDGMLY